MKSTALALFLGGAALAAAAPEPGWLGAPSAPEASSPEAPEESQSESEPGEDLEGEAAATLAARRVLDVMRRWPGPPMVEGRRMELVWVAHDLEQRGHTRAGGIVRRFLRRYERAHCDRRDAAQEAASARLSPARLVDLRKHLDVFHRVAFTRDQRLPEGYRELGIFRGVPICRYRM